MYISPPDVHISKYILMFSLQIYVRVSQQNIFFENEKNDLFLWYLGFSLKGPKSTFDFDKFYRVHMAVKNLTDISLA